MARVTLDRRIRYFISDVVGVPGPGVPVGGSVGQVLTKFGAGDYESDWEDSGGGGGGGVVVINVASTADVVLTSGQEAARLIVFEGAPGGVFNVLFIDSQAWCGAVFNNTTGGHDLVAQNSTGVKTTVGVGLILDLVVDGGNVFEVPSAHWWNAKGILLGCTADSQLARILPGVDGYVLVADSAEPAGVGWGPGIAAAGLVELLAYDQAADINGTLTTSTWGDVLANQSFVVPAGGSLVRIDIGGYVGGDGQGAASFAARMVIDSAGAAVNYLFAGSAGSYGYENYLAGAIFWLGTLAPGTHTVKLQLYSNSVSASWRCLAASFAPMSLRVRVCLVG